MNTIYFRRTVTHTVRRTALFAVFFAVGFAVPAVAQDRGGRPSQTAPPPTQTQQPSPVVGDKPAVAEPDDQPDNTDISGEDGQSDARIQNRLASVFEQVEELDEVAVQVRSGVVQLTGTTPGLEGQKQAAELARTLEGVMYVDNDIEVPPDVGQRVSPLLDKSREMAWRVAEYLPLLGIGLVILFLFGLLARFIGSIEWPFTRLSAKPLLQGLIRQTVAIVVFLSGLLFVLELFDVTTLVGAVLGTAGVAGLALGFAFRDIAENYLASIILSIQQPFQKNDYVKMGDYEGKVIRLTTRDTVLMSLDGNHIRIPNAVIFKSPSANFTRNPLRRFECLVGVGVDEDLLEVQRIGMETMTETPGLRADPEPFMYVEELADSSVVVSFYGWVDQNEFDWGRVRSECLRRIKISLDAAGVEMPEPIHRNRVVRLDQETAPQPQERQRQAEEALQEPGPSVEQTPEIDEQIKADREQSEETDLLE